MQLADIDLPEASTDRTTLGLDLDLFFLSSKDVSDGELACDEDNGACCLYRLVFLIKRESAFVAESLDKVETECFAGRMIKIFEQDVVVLIGVIAIEKPVVKVLLVLVGIDIIYQCALATTWHPPQPNVGVSVGLEEVFALYHHGFDLFTVEHPVPRVLVKDGLFLFLPLEHFVDVADDFVDLALLFFIASQCELTCVVTWKISMFVELEHAWIHFGEHLSVVVTPSGERETSISGAQVVVLRDSEMSEDGLAGDWVLVV